MRKNILSILLSSLLLVGSVSADVHKIASIQEILPFVEKDSLIVFNVTEVLTDSSISLGSQAWRKYVKSKQDAWKKPHDFNLHDLITLYVYKHVPQRSVEEITPAMIRELQLQGNTVLALTCKGKSEWYSTPAPNIDTLTIDTLAAIGIDLSISYIPEEPFYLETLFGKYYANGILFTAHLNKGQLLANILDKTQCLPKKVIFVDDKVDSLEEVENHLHRFNIPFEGFWYAKTKKDHADFSPIVSTIQLENLIFQRRIINDEDAKTLAERISDPDGYFYDLLDRIDFSVLE